MKQKNKQIITAFLICCCLLFAGCASIPRSRPINIHKLSDNDIVMVGQILDKLEPIINERRQQNLLAKLAFEDLYVPLNLSQSRFLHNFQNMDTTSLNFQIPYQGIVNVPDLVIIESHKITDSNGSIIEIPPHYLTDDVFNAYTQMAAAMKKEIGKTLFVASGYRSPAYQFYLFIFYLKNHNYSILETSRFVAWPGYSEHGNPKCQAIDFVNEQGIDGQNNPAEFEMLQEYEWLVKNADKYGFQLSYPKNSTMSFEPWHWRYKGAGF